MFLFSRTDATSNVIVATYGAFAGKHDVGVVAAGQRAGTVTAIPISAANPTANHVRDAAEVFSTCGILKGSFLSQNPTGCRGLSATILRPARLTHDEGQCLGNFRRRPGRDALWPF